MEIVFVLTVTNMPFHKRWSNTSIKNVVLESYSKSHFSDDENNEAIKQPSSTLMKVRAAICQEVILT
jgi:hypothetical protein